MRMCIEYQRRYTGRTDADLAGKFEANTLKTKGFALVRDYVKENAYAFEMSSAYENIKRFQLLRNKLVHLNYFFDINDKYDLKHDVIFILVHVIPSLLKEDAEENVEFLLRTTSIPLGDLIDFPPYIEAMQEEAERQSSDVYKCQECGNRTMAAEQDLCFACGFQFEAFRRLRCKKCEAPDSILFDSLNIDIQKDSSINGLCLNCGERVTVFKCPDCSETTVVEWHTEDECSVEEGCKFI